MTGGERQRDEIPPTERRGGAPLGDAEAQEKGAWAETAREGVVPAEHGGSDAEEKLLGDDPELASSVVGGPAASEEPATDEGVDLSAGDHADATSDGGAERPDRAEPDLRDAAAGPRQVDLDAES
jgi:hypothetical protein